VHAVVFSLQLRRTRVRLSFVLFHRIAMLSLCVYVKFSLKIIRLTWMLFACICLSSNVMIVCSD